MTSTARDPSVREPDPTAPASRLAGPPHSLPDASGPRHALAESARITRRYLLFLGCGAQDADDVVQEALLAALARWPQGDVPRPWLLATVRNLHLKMLRTRGRRREIADSERLHVLWVEAAPEDGGEALRAATRRCLRDLPPRSRRALQLRYGESLGRTGIAAELGIGVEGIKSLLARARAAVAECVERRMRQQGEDGW